MKRIQIKRAAPTKVWGTLLTMTDEVRRISWLAPRELEEGVAALRMAGVVVVPIAATDDETGEPFLSGIGLVRPEREQVAFRVYQDRIELHITPNGPLRAETAESLLSRSTPRLTDLDTRVLASMEQIESWTEQDRLESTTHAWATLSGSSASASVATP